MIRFSFLEICEEIKEKLRAVYKNHAPLLATIRYWFIEFKHGRISVFYEERTGHAMDDDIVLTGRRVKIIEIADMMNISIKRMKNILHEKLGIRKLSARWVPHLLTVEQKQNRVTTSEHYLNIFKGNPKEFLWRFVTVDETWIHHHTPKTKE